MGIKQVEKILSSQFPPELTLGLLSAYKNALFEARKHNWQYVGNEIGQFVECSRRVIEFKLSTKFTPLTEKLPIFNNSVLDSWEKIPKTIACESYRIIIPRVLYSMYCIRNKRGMIHKSSINPNSLDASQLIASQKWVLAEMIRLESNLSFHETEKIIQLITSKEIDILWQVEETGIRRVLNVRMRAKEKVLILLYIENCQTENSLKTSIEYSNSSMFHKLILSLHKDRLIEYAEGKCILSPLGVEQAETLLRGQ